MSNKPVFWKQANGKLVSVDEMDANHLKNVLKMIIRNQEKALQQTKPKVEFKLNGDIAEAFNDSHAADENDVDHYKFESDLGPMFNDDETRGNQW